MPFIRKRRIWWEPVPEATSYVVYVSKDNRIRDPAKFLWENTPDVVSKPVIGKRSCLSRMNGLNFQRNQEHTTSGLHPETMWRIKVSPSCCRGYSNFLPLLLLRKVGSRVSRWFVPYCARDERSFREALKR